MKLSVVSQKNRLCWFEWKIVKPLKFYYTVPSPSLPLGSSNRVGKIKPLNNGNVAPKWWNGGTTHLLLIVLKYKVAVFFVFFFLSFFITVQSNPDLTRKRKGWGKEKRKNSWQGGVLNKRKEKCFNKLNERTWWPLGYVLHVINLLSLHKNWWQMEKKKHNSEQWQI